MRVKEDVFTHSDCPLSPLCRAILEAALSLSLSQLRSLPFSRTLGLFVKSVSVREHSPLPGSLRFAHQCKSRERQTPVPQTFPAPGSFGDSSHSLPRIPSITSPPSSENLQGAWLCCSLGSCIYCIYYDSNNAKTAQLSRHIRVFSTCTYILIFHLMTHLRGSFLRWHFTEKETEAQSIEVTRSLKRRSSHPIQCSVVPNLLIFTL